MSFADFAVFKRSRWCKRVVWAAVVFLVYTLVGFLVLPPILKWQMLKRLPGVTKRQAAIRQVKFNPLVLSLTIRGLALTEPDGRPFASWDELYINFQASSLFRWAWTFKEIRLVRPCGEVILFNDGRLNFANMFESPPKPVPPPKPKRAGIPRVNIFRLEVTNGFVAFEDRTRHPRFRTEYRPINLNLTRFTTRPNSDTPYSFHAESDAGRSVDWAGDVSIQPFRSQGRIGITGVRLSRYQPYLEDFTRARLTNGLADLLLSYRFQAGSNGMDLFVTNGAVLVEQLQLQDPDTGETVAAMRGFDVQRAELNLRERAARLGRVKVSEATLLARLKPDGHVNLLDLLTLPPASTNPPPASAGAAPPWTVTVDDFAIENTAVSLEDLTHRTPFKTDLKPIAVSLKDFTTKPDSDAHYSFRIASESAETFAGSGTLSINPVRSGGEVELAAVEVKKYLPYAEDFFRGKITAGQLGVRAPYRFALATNGLQAAVSNLTVTLTGLEVKGPDTDETVTRIAEFRLEEVEAGLQERRARVGRVKAGGGSILARRQKDGSINLLGLLAAAGTNRASATGSLPASSAAPGWVVSVDEVSLSDYTLKIDDQQPPKPVALLMDQLALNLKGVSTAGNAPISAAVSLRFNETGAIAARGTARLAPLFADLELSLTNLDLRAAQSYLEQYVRLGVVSGALSTHGQARYQTGDPSVPGFRFAGNVSVANFVCTDQVAFKEFARWNDLAVTGIECGLQPNRLKVDEVKWVAPKATLVLGADHKPNLALILQPTQASGTNAVPRSAPGEIAARPGAEVFPIQIGTVRLERAAFAFADESVQPHASLGIQEISGTLKGLSSALNTAADVDLAGKVDEQSPFGVAGRINPLAADLFVDLVISNANTQLIPLTPYMEKYAGHSLNKGRLTTTLRYHVEGKELKADNKIGIDHLTLGPRNNSPDATSLPVKLAVALLKDNNGHIGLDLPLHGRLDDPQFSLGPILLKVLMNMLAKAVASPFKLLGALVGGGEELSFVAFVPGTTNLVEGELDKLAKLSKALAQRPALNLEVEGAIDPVADHEALAMNKLRERLKAKRLQELSAKGKAAQSLESLQLDPEDYDRLLRAAFTEQFGTNIAAILRTNQLAAAATNQPSGTMGAKVSGKPKQPLYRRALGWVGLDRHAGKPFYQPALAWVGLERHARKSAVEKRLTKADRLALGQAAPATMETLVAGQLPVTDENYRALMNERARWVQNWLLQNGHVAAERLLLVAPKPVDGAYRGESRANLSLD